MATKNTIKKLHIDLENKTVGVEFQQGEVRSRHVLTFEEIGKIDLSAIENAVQAKLDADVTELSDGVPQKLTSNLH